MRAWFEGRGTGQQGEVGVVGEQDISLQFRECEGDDDVFEPCSRISFDVVGLARFGGEAPMSARHHGWPLVVVGAANHVEALVRAADAVAPSMPDRYPRATGLEGHFFVAWFVGRTVSQASFNLRRREIGLLMTKGFSQTQLFRHFLVEALLVGLIGGGLGLAAVVLLNPYFVQILSGSYQSSAFLGQDTAVATIIFTLALTVIAIYSPARAAATLPMRR